MSRELKIRQVISVGASGPACREGHEHELQHGDEKTLA